jgi:hypothetical protein
MKAINSTPQINLLSAALHYACQEPENIYPAIPACSLLVKKIEKSFAEILSRFCGVCYQDIPDELHLDQKKVGLSATLTMTLDK